MAQKTIKATCNQVNKRVKNTQVRFNISGKGDKNSGNVRITINEGSLNGFEPGKEYSISIKEA